MAQPVLRPFSVSEMIDVSFTILRRRFTQMVIVAAVITVPFGIVQVFATPDAFSSDAFETGEFTQADIDAFLEPGQWIAFGIVVLLGVIASIAATGALTSIVGDEYLNVPSTWRSSLSVGLRRLPAVLGAIFIAGAIAIAGWLAIAVVTVIALPLGIILIIAGIAFTMIAYVSIWIFVPALIVEDLSPWDSLKRSWKLVGGRRWPIFGTILLAGLIVNIATTIVTTVAALPFPGPQQLAVSQITGVLAGLVTTPFTAIVTTVVYFDQRVRKEGFDMELLSSQLGLPLDYVENPVESFDPTSAAPPPAPAPPPIGTFDAPTADPPTAPPPTHDPPGGPDDEDSNPAWPPPTSD